MFARTNDHRKIFLLLPLILLLSASAAVAQGTAFTFQGKLGNAGSPVNGAFDMQFKLFDAADPNSSSQIGTTITLNNPLVQVTNGIFTVQLDFGAAALPGSDRFLEIGVRGNSAEPYSLLTPRSKITSSPYAIRSLNATGADGMSPACVGCIQNSQINSVDANKLTGTLPSSLFSGSSLPAGSGNYIQTNPPSPQSANFNISGNGTIGGTVNGNAVNAMTQYNLGNSRILSAPGGSNLFVGSGAGLSNTAGNFNSFFGLDAGRSNATGASNSFFGAKAGSDNSDGSFNAFYGVNAGRSNISGSGNTFFGSGPSPQGTGFSNTDGSFNSFFGHRTGELSNGSSNSFFGAGAGRNNISGGGNSFFGHDAGGTNRSGSLNIVLGDGADVGAGNLTNATAIGSNALVTTSNSLVLGSINGINGATANTNVGIGITAPTERLHVIGNGFFSGSLIAYNVNANVGTFSGLQTDFFFAKNVTINQPNPSSTGLTINGNAQIGFLSLALDSGGTTPVCWKEIGGRLTDCHSSSIRYKQNVKSFAPGLSMVNRLRPVSFNWKADNQPDMGLVAEEVEKVEPLLVNYNAKGEVEGVKYDRINVVLINAVKEQQAQIEHLLNLNATLNSRLRAIEKRLQRRGGPSRRRR